MHEELFCLLLVAIHTALSHCSKSGDPKLKWKCMEVYQTAPISKI